MNNRLVTGFTIAMAGLVLTPTAQASDIGPTSLLEYASLRDGNWTTTMGNKDSGMVGIKSTGEWGPDGDNFMTDWVVHSMKDEIVSRGSGYTYWDPAAKTVKSQYSGLMDGKPFHGTMKLTKGEGRTWTWNDERTLDDGTNQYFITTDTFNGLNQWVRTVEFADKNYKGTGKMLATQDWKRNNNLLTAAPGLKSLVGLWKWPNTNAYGENVVDWISWKFGPGQHVLLGSFYESDSNGKTRFVGDSRVWFNPGDRRIHFHYTSLDGKSITGTANNFQSAKGQTSWRWDYQGFDDVGESMAGAQNITVTDTTYKWTFDWCTFDGREIPVAMLNKPDRVFNKVSNNPEMNSADSINDVKSISKR